MTLREKNEIEIFRRYCKNQYTKEDLKIIFEWFEKSGFNFNRRISIKKRWIDFLLNNEHKKEAEYDQSQMLDQIHHQINIEKSAAKKQKTNLFTREKILQTLSRVAAILIIPLLILSISLYRGKALHKNQITYSEVFAPNNSRTRLTLPDETEVWLNHGSILKYPLQFSKSRRNVQLTGEAFFKVTKDHSRPFQVKTSDLDITVLGTSFNVSAYQDDNTILTTVEEGKVILHSFDSNNKKKHVTELTANMQSVFNINSKQDRVKQVNPEEYTAWKEGMLILNDDSMEVVKKKLERWYNVDIIIRDQELFDYKYSATFINEPIEQVVKLLSLATPISYEIKWGEKQSNNMIGKTKIIFRNKK